MSSPAKKSDLQAAVRTLTYRMVFGAIAVVGIEVLTVALIVR